MTYNGFSKSVTAAVLFKASSSFDAAVTKPGCNVSNMLSAIGPKGLTMLWHQLTVFAWTVSLSQVCLVLPPFVSLTGSTSCLDDVSSPGCNI